MKPNQTVVFELCTTLKSSYEDSLGNRRNSIRSLGLGAEAIMLYEDEDGDSYIRTIRYVKSHKSPFKDIQDEDLDPNVKLWRIMSKPQFTDGILAVNPTQKNLLEFLRNHPANEQNQHWGLEGQKAMFRERNPAKIAQELNKKNKQVINASRFVYDSDFLTKIVPIAEYLGFSTDKESDLVLWDVDTYARANPERFIELLDSPIISRYSDAKLAVKRGVIRVMGQQVSWADGRQIVDTPVNKEPLEHLVELSFDNSYSNMWAEVQRLLNKVSTPKEDTQAISKGASSKSEELNEISTADLIDELKKESIIVWQTPFFVIDEKQIKGKDKLIEYVEANKKTLAARLL